MKLYAFSGSCAVASHITLEWIGAPYTLELIKKEDLQKPELVAKNPNRQVPILEVDGWVLVENAAILNYLADKFPDAKLCGDGGPRARAEVNRWLGFLNSDVHPAFKPLFGATAYLGDASAIDKTKARAREVLRGYFETLDKQLEGRDWLTGSRSVADPYLFIVLRWCRALKLDLSGLDNLEKFEQRMRADAGVQKALRAQHLEP